MNRIRIIPTTVHGVLDYLGGIILIIAPNIFGFDNVGGVAVWLPRILGVAFLLMALLTNYELSLVKVIPMSAHLGIDIVASIVLAISPFVFGFSDNPANVWLPHVVVGVGYLIVSLLTQTEPHHEATRARA
jgi:hypothetical protein